MILLVVTNTNHVWYLGSVGLNQSKPLFPDVSVSSGIRNVSMVEDQSGFVLLYFFHHQIFCTHCRRIGTNSHVPIDDPSERSFLSNRNISCEIKNIAHMLLSSK